MADVDVVEAPDVPIEAIAALVRGAIQADVGPEALLAVYEDPRDLYTIAADKLPALCVYRAGETRVRRSSAGVDHDITVGFDYAMPSANLDQKARRWPKLAAVWASISDAVIAGKHAAVDDGTEVLVAAATQADEDTARASYSMAQGGRDSNPQIKELYPILRGTIVVTHRPYDIDVPVLDAFLQLNTSFDEPGSDHTDPLLTDTLELEGGS